MGEVYRARDTRLGREVAIKVLSEDFAGDAERVARFEREARSASALSHAHVVAVFDVGHEGESFYIVSEIVAGGTLRNLLDRGPLPLRRVLDFAVQIASGLAEAHESGIVHRDLKPENILLTKTGDAKIADFGLAKLAETGEAGVSQLPTSDGLKTSAGMVMGTVAYMSPEQASGRPVDFRSDQFSFGSILYEALTGKPPFRRATAAETMAAVIRDEPEPARSANSSVSPQLAWVLERCLAKEAGGRYASTRDLARELAFIRERVSEAKSGPETAAASSAHLPRRSLLPLAGAGAVGAVVAAVLSLFLVRPAPPQSSLIRFPLPPPAEGGFLSQVDTINFAVSPDGSRVAFIAQDRKSSPGGAGVARPTKRIWVRSLSESEPRLLAGTDGVTSIFWSPDGRSIGFSSGTQLKRIDLLGGSPLPICDLASGFAFSGTWGGRTILFSTIDDGIIYRVPADGGTATPFLRPDRSRNEPGFAWPVFLPDGKRFLYIAGRQEGQTQLRIASLDGPGRTVGPISSRVEFMEPGFVLFGREGALFAQRFDPKAAVLSGPVLPVAPSVYNFYSSRWADFSVSHKGTLVYAPRGNISRLTWFDRTGRVLGEIETSSPGETDNLAISPDGQSALFDRTRPDLGTFDIWIVDLDRGIETRVSSDPNTEYDPVWLPDGKHIVYSVARGYFPRLVRSSLDGGPEEPLLAPGTFQMAMSATPDGKGLLFSQSGKGMVMGLWMLPLDGSRKPVSVATSRWDQEIGCLSPDGRLLAFISEESGQREAYLEVLGSSERKVRVSTAGAARVRWSRDGREVFYTTPDRRLIAARVTTTPSLRIEGSTTLFSLPPEGWQGFDVTPDGRFLASVPRVSAATEPLSVVTNVLSAIVR